MKILVTGSTGFVGSKVIPKLQGFHNVSGFARKLEERGKVSFIKGDITDKESVMEAVKGKDIVIHLAALLDESAGRKKLFEVNVQGTKNVVEACRKKKVKQLIYLSTAGVHGKISREINEDARHNPETHYEASKSEAEKIVLKSGLNYTILRAAIVYGTNEYWKGILRQVKKGFPLIGSGKNIWQMIFVEDLADAIIFCLNNKACFKQTFLVAEAEKHSLKEVYEVMCRLLGVEPKEKFLSYHMGMMIAFMLSCSAALRRKKSIIHPMHVKRLVRERNYDVSKMAKAGWKAKTKVEEGMKKTIKELIERREL